MRVRSRRIVRPGMMASAAAGLLALVVMPGPAKAQVGNAASPLADPVPAPLSTAVPIPPPPVVVLPVTTPKPIPSKTPRPRPTLAVTPSPTPSSVPAPLPTPTPEVTASAAARESVIDAAPSPVASAARRSTTAARGAPAGGDGGGSNLRWLIPALAVAVAIVAGLLLARRRRSGADDALGDNPAAPLVAPQPVVSTASSGARLELTLRPMRAGLNLLSATSENEIVVTNRGDGDATDVRIQARLFSAHAEQATDLARYHAEPIVRPVVPPFALAPGESRSVSATAAMPREAIRPLTAGGRPMLVPIVAINITYSRGEGDGGQMAQAFAIGIERVDTPKLAPFWLDIPPRGFDQVAARPQPPSIDR